MSASAIRLVCFDLGGVLVRICRDWTDACRTAGLEARGVTDNGFPESPQWREVALQFSTGAIDASTWRQRASEAMNGVYSPDEIHCAHRAWLLGEYDGVGEVIDRIHEAGLRTASLSNTDAAHWETLITYPSVARLHHPLASHLLRHCKPDPAIYRAFEAQVNQHGPEILFFDDLPENVKAARQAGWHAVRIDPHACTASQIRRTLDELAIL